MAKRDPIKSNGVENDLKMLGKYNSALNVMGRAIESNNKKLVDYKDNFKALNTELRQLITLTKGNKLSLDLGGGKGRTSKGSGGSSNNTNRGSSNDTSDANKTRAKNKKIIEGQFKDLNIEIIKSTDVLQKELTHKLSALASAVIGGASKNGTSVILQNAGSAAKSALSLGGNASKAIQMGLKYSQAKKLAATATNSSVAAGAAETASAAGAAGLTAVAGIVVAAGAAIAALGVASKIAADRQSQVAKSLLVMNQSLDKNSKVALSAHNKQIKITNAFENLADLISYRLVPIFDGLAGLLLNLTEGLGLSTKESDVKRVNTQGSISASAQQSGFNIGSANVLARDTYKLAEQYNEKFGDTVEQMSKNLADAWLNGSDAAKNYGVVVDDLTLSGYMASKGIDIVNVEISEAMKQYYRFQLVQEEMNRDSDSGMSQNIKNWKQYGMIIDQTKNKLFSFDEVIQLNAFDPTIPDLGTAEIGRELEDSLNPTINPIIGKPKNTPDPIDVPINPIVNPPIADIISAFGLIPSSVDVDVNANVNGAAAVAKLQSNLEAVTVPWSTTLTLICPALAVAQSILGLLENITGKSWQSELGLNVQGQELVDNAYASLQAVAGTYVANTVFKVTGLDQLREALHLAKELEQYKVSSSSYNEKYTQTSMNESAMQAGNASKILNRSKEDILNQALHPITSSLANKSYKSATSSSNSIKNFGADVNASAGGFSASNNVLNAINEYKNKNNNTNQKLETYKGAYLYGTTLDKNLKALTVGVGLATGGAAAVGGLTGLAGAGLSSASAGTSADIISRSELLEHYFAKNKLTAELIADSFGAKASGFASGGIGTKESMIHAFEGDRAEAVIPLESQQGIDYLGNAMKQALGGDDGAGSSNITVNVNLSGLNLADNDAQWDRVGRKISEVIAIQNQRRGNLNYGSK